MAIKKRTAVHPVRHEGDTLAIKPAPTLTGNAFWQALPQHIMSGISRMVPTLIMGGVILAISQLIAYVWLKIPPDTGIMEALNSGKFTGFTLSVLKFGYLTESFGGLVATQPTQVLNFSPEKLTWLATKPVPSTFIGALIIAIAAGYLVKALNSRINLPHYLLAFKSTFLIPILSALFVMLAMYYVIIPIGGWLNAGMRALLLAAGQAGSMMYAIGMAAATAIDLGGPINKAAGFVGLGLTTDRVLPITSRAVAIVIPPIGLGLATLIDHRLTGKRLFSPQLYPQGKTAMFLAFMGISEGAIPFLLENPLATLPAYMIGAIAGAMTATALGAVQWFPESAIWAWPLVTNLGAYMLSILVGAVITALLVVTIRHNMHKRGKLTIDAL